MHLYGDNFSPVHEWNAVNVKRNDGLLQHGKVINVVENGLIIDFGWPGQKSQFVEYGKVFDCSEYQNGAGTDWMTSVLYDPRRILNADVEVLMRVGRGRQWTWLPAKVLISFYPEWRYMFVEVELEGAKATELLPLGQIRIPPSATDLKRMKIDQDLFVTRSCVLPKDCWSSISPHHVLYGLIGGHIGQLCNAYPIYVLSETLVYLQRRSMAPVHPSALEVWLKTAKHRIDSCIRSGQEQWVCRHDLARKSTKLRKEKLSYSGLPVPLELVIETFQCLDTVSRTRCRRVCSQWEALLGMKIYFQDTIVSFNQSSFSPSPQFNWDPLYAVACCLFKRTTKRMVIMNMNESYSRDTLCLISTIDNNFGKRIPELIFRNCGFDAVCPGLAGLVQSFTDSRKGWDKLVLHNCTISHPEINARIEHVSLATGSSDEKKQQAVLWNIVENSMDAVDLPCIQQWVADAVAEESADKRRELATNLRFYQSSDCREAAYYRDHQWSEENLEHLDVTKLTKVTLHAIKTLMKRNFTMDADNDPDEQII